VSETDGFQCDVSQRRPPQLDDVDLWCGRSKSMRTTSVADAEAGGLGEPLSQLVAIELGCDREDGPEVE
jgi:hypothetical protein